MANSRMGGDPEPRLRAWIYREDEFWTVVDSATTVRLRDGKGLRYLAQLAATPGVQRHALDLARVADEELAETPQSAALANTTATVAGDPRGSLRERLRELDEELEEAEAFHDVERAANARRALESVEREVAELLGGSADGDGPQDGDAAAGAERARVNVTRALRSTIKRISARAPRLGQYLDMSINTGAYCTFAPPADFELIVGSPDAPQPRRSSPTQPPRADADSPRAARVLVSIELLGTTAASARVGATDAQLTRHDATVRAQVAFYGGQAAARQAERTLAVFDSPDAAMRCLATIFAAARDAGAPVKAGIHVGECEILGDTVTGLAVQAAARLAALAHPGEVLISTSALDTPPSSDTGLEPTPHGDVAEGWSGFALRDAESASLAAPPAPTALRLPSRLQAAADRPLFGRAVELDVIDGALARAGAGEPAFVAIAGEPGIGKTRLSAEAAVHAHALGATVLFGRCGEDLVVPYQPFVEALTAYAALATLPATDGASVLQRLIPQLGDGAPHPHAITSDGERYVLFSEVAQLLAAAPGPLTVLVIDDLQWADSESLLLLKHLFRASTPLRLAIVASYRPTDVPEDHPLAELLAVLGAEDGFTRLDLAGLGQADILALTAQLAGEAVPAPLLELARALAGETRGNAFFTTEILRHLADSGDLARAAADWRAGRDSGPPQLPGTVRETIARRVARLGTKTQELLEVAATIGAEFDVGLLTHAAQRDEDDVLDALDTAIAAGLVSVPDEETRRYAFAHSLVADTLYGALAPGRRRRTHRVIARALEAQLGPIQSPPSPRVAELAHHVLRGAYAEDLEKALHYVQLAGDHALAQLAPLEAARWYRRALDLAEQTPLDDTGRCELLIGLGTAQNQAGEAGYRETLLRAAAIARAHDDGERLARAALANTRGFVSATGLVDTERVQALEQALELHGDVQDARRARLLAVLGAELTFSGDWERRVQLADEALTIARRVADPTAVADVLSTRFMTLWTPETLSTRVVDSIEELQLAQRHGDLLARFRAVHWRAVTCVESGETVEAARLVEQEAALAEQLGQPIAQWLAAYDRATQSLIHGLLDDAQSWAQKAGQIATDSGQPEAAAFLAGQLINILFERGTLPELEPLIAQQARENPGIPAFTSALALARAEGEMFDAADEILDVQTARGFRDLPYDSNWLVGLAIFAEAAGRTRNAGAAAVLHPLLEPFAAIVAFNSATTWGLIERPLGMLASALGRRDEAHTRLRRALAAHERMGAPLWVARTRLDLATLLDAREDEARELARRAHATADELGATTIAARASALLNATAETS